MIGVSLSSKYLTTGKGMEEAPEILLRRLYRLGVRSVEIRDAKPSADPVQVHRAAELLWNEGFNVTVHCRVFAFDSGVDDVFRPISLVLKHLRQEKLTVTIHPIVGDNIELLCMLSDYAQKNGMPVIIALENNRLLPDGKEGDSTALVLEAVKGADRKNVGICFDMGHYRYFLKRNHPDKLDMLPSEEFFKRVVHTHIHALNGLNTHFPLDQFDLPLQRILLEQTVGYYGVLNIELSFPRYADIRQPVDSLVGSVKTLKAALPERALIYDELRNSYDRKFYDALSVFNGKEKGTKMALTQCASYLFNTNGLAWAMDFAFLGVLWKLTKTPYYAHALLKDLKLIVVTHKHSDHFEKRTVKSLSKNEGLTWIIPDFLVDCALEYGISKEKIIVARQGEVIHFDCLNILPFKGRHTRKEEKVEYPSFGYYVTAEGAPSMVFPGDVRDYSADDIPDSLRADYCFAHIWLGDGGEFDEQFPMSEEFSRYMLRFSDKNILLSHLYNSMRKLGYMWTVRHASAVSCKIKELSPKTNVYVPRVGQVLTLV